jgi:hypothetical protein
MRRKVHGMTQNVPCSLASRTCVGQPLAIARTALTNLTYETFEGLCAAIQVRIGAGVVRLKPILPIRIATLRPDRVARLSMPDRFQIRFRSTRIEPAPSVPRKRKVQQAYEQHILAAGSAPPRGLHR